ncbi:MAG: nucleotide sugar dehydrogenase [Pseudomonadota bacterium]
MQNPTISVKDSLLAKIEDRSARIGVVGMGYVGLPLALAVAHAGLHVTGFDIDRAKPEKLLGGESYLKHIPADAIAAAVKAGALDATSDFDRLSAVDIIVICVPTPLTRHQEPDLSFLTKTAESIASRLRAGHVVIVESTTYPGTTDEVVRPILEAGGMVSGTDFYLAFSPEREDPGNADFSTQSIPKVVGSDHADATDLAAAFYGAFVGQVVPVTSSRVAEAAKLTENIFRAVNIALVNELKSVYGAMGVDVWEVIEAAKTKPFGFMPFYPGPGLGGHCIPIDPFYLTWKAKEYDIATRFIELAGQINSTMPMRVVERLAMALDTHHRKGVNGARILVIGVAYKKNVDDMRESPALRLIELLEGRGADTEYYDPYVPTIPMTREHAALAGRNSVAWREKLSGDYDVVLIATDHDGIDYAALLAHAPLVVDTRNACRKAGASGDNLVLA